MEVYRLAFAVLAAAEIVPLGGCVATAAASERRARTRVGWVSQVPVRSVDAYFVHGRWMRRT